MTEEKVIVDDPSMVNSDSDHDKAKSPALMLTYAVIGLTLVMVAGSTAALMVLGYTGDYLMNSFYDSFSNPLDSAVQIG